jgi:hypothetical protein
MCKFVVVMRLKKWCLRTNMKLTWPWPYVLTKLHARFNILCLLVQIWLKKSVTGHQNLKTQVLHCISLQFHNLRSIVDVNGLVWFMVFNATFNNISVISWQSVLLMEEARVPGENHWHVASHWQTLSHNIVSSTPRHERGSNSQL